jgi:hypothetical protein
MQIPVINFHSLLAAVINRAIDDLKGVGLRCRKKELDNAMEFILSETCEAYCMELEIDYKVVREKAAALYRRIIEKEAPAEHCPNSHAGYQVTAFEPFQKQKRVKNRPYPSHHGSPRGLISSRKSL